MMVADRMVVVVTGDDGGASDDCGNDDGDGASADLNTLLICLGLLLACMSVNHMHAWCPQRPEEGI